jgi:hypothetical protein
MNKKIPPAIIIFQANVANIFKRVWPAIIFANKRTDRATTLKTYEIISIGTNSGAKARGAPGGKNKLKKKSPCLLIPNMFRPIKDIMPKLKVKKI